LLGVAQRELGCQLSEAISHLSKALEQAREQGDSIKDEIWRELARAKYLQWQQDSAARNAAAAALKQQLQLMLQAQRLQGEVAGAAAVCGHGGPTKCSLEEQQQAAMQQWEQLLQRAAHLDSRTEVPAAFTCPLTMEVSNIHMCSFVGGVFEFPEVVLCGCLRSDTLQSWSAPSCPGGGCAVPTS
jgi:STIP1 family protein 1